jgi:hypothetical protein
MSPEELEAERTYAQLFRRAMRDPGSLTEAELAQLTDEDLHLYTIRCDVEAQVIDNELRKRCGMGPLPLSQRISRARLKELREAMRRPEWSPLDIPLDEWIALCAGGQLEEVVCAD